MRVNSWNGRFALSAVAASLVAYAAGCAGDKPPRLAEDPIFTSAEVIPPPPPPAAPLAVPVSPNVSVSDELLAACKLRFNDASSAPKFDFDQSQLGSEDNDVLSQVATCVTTGPLRGRTLDLVGRADPRGTGEYNMALGDRRATTVRGALLGLGVDGGSVSSSSRGKLDATGTDEAGWQRDRRVDILLR